MAKLHLSKGLWHYAFAVRVVFNVGLRWLDRALREGAMTEIVRVKY